MGTILLQVAVSPQISICIFSISDSINMKTLFIILAVLAVLSFLFSMGYRKLKREGAIDELSDVLSNKPGKSIESSEDLNFKENGSSFAVEITAVAHLDTREGQDGVLVRYSYTDPETDGFIQDEESVLDYSQVKSNRVARIAVPGTAMFGTGTKQSIQHNQRLWSKYYNDVKNREISSGEKKDLLKIAKSQMTAKAPDISPRNAEGFVEIDPPAPMTGYRLNGETRFFPEDDPVLYDWTVGLE